MVAMRVSRRTALVAAAGWVAAPVRADAEGWRCAPEDGASGAESGADTAPGRVHVLYRDLARFLRDPDPDRARALRRALRSPAARAAAAAYGDRMPSYLAEQAEGLTAADAAWAERADAADVPDQVHEGLRRARALLDADELPNVYLIFSRCFDGRTDGRAIFVGVDRFGADGLRDRVALLTAHEYNHVVRARTASFATLIGGIMAEGLATACSAQAEPGRPLHDYLLYAPAQLAWFTPERLAHLWADLAENAAGDDPALRRAYLHGAEPGPFGAPPRAGYYLGYLIVRDWLARGASIAELTRMPAAALWEGSGHAQ